jgi:hypothetical protein
MSSLRDEWLNYRRYTLACNCCTSTDLDDYIEAHVLADSRVHPLSQHLKEIGNRGTGRRWERALQFIRYMREADRGDFIFKPSPADLICF